MQADTQFWIFLGQFDRLVEARSFTIRLAMVKMPPRFARMTA